MLIEEKRLEIAGQWKFNSFWWRSLQAEGKALAMRSHIDFYEPLSVNSLVH